MPQKLESSKAKQTSMPQKLEKSKDKCLNVSEAENQERYTDLIV